MAVSRAKKFETIIRESFEKVPDTVVTRLPDPVQGYLGVRNISDFIVYRYPHQYFIECKTIQGNTFPFNNVTSNQFDGMLTASKYKGVIAGVLVWWVDKDVTKFIPIQFIDYVKHYKQWKSIRYDFEADEIITLRANKKRVFFSYDMKSFFKEIENGKGTGTENTGA